MFLLFLAPTLPPRFILLTQYQGQGQIGIKGWIHCHSVLLKLSEFSTRERGWVRSRLLFTNYFKRYFCVAYIRLTNREHFFVCMPFSLSSCMSVRLSIFVCPFVCLSKSAHMSAYLCLPVSVYLCLSFCISVFLSVCPSAYVSVCWNRRHTWSLEPLLFVLYFHNSGLTGLVECWSIYTVYSFPVFRLLVWCPVYSNRWWGKLCPGPGTGFRGGAHAGGLLRL